MFLYAHLHLAGYDIGLDDIKTFRKVGSKCAGHPEFGLAPGIETTTGPLGQGIANAVGMAIAESMLAARFNTAKRKISRPLHLHPRGRRLPRGGRLGRGILPRRPPQASASSSPSTTPTRSP
jgi:hypothetical protein